MVKPKKNIKISSNADIYTIPSRILVFGAAGYVGRMVCDLFCSSPDVREIIAVDAMPMPELLKRKKKITWIEADLSKDGWQELLKDSVPDVAIHTAWDLNENPDSIKNFEASEKIFKYCFTFFPLKKIIYLSSILPYGAEETNDEEKRFSEGEIFRESEYSYVVLRKETEALLAKLYSISNRTKSVFVLRPGMISGPMGVSLRLQREPVLRVLDVLPYVFDTGSNYGLQYVHEDDLLDLLAVLVFNKVPFKGYEVFNVVAEDVVDIKDIASYTGKSIFKLPAFFFSLFLALFGSRFSEGASKSGIWRYLSYPVFADGSKLAKKLKFELLYSAKEALLGERGRYDYLIQKEDKKEDNL
ncbi:MAG TPA: NAD-dependent epimerase/dehydratase family protein [Candidatus Paceibacterota bacterium]|nr:NAD-dependent epimerase/dehydratase family protein [Candidatus Paceibacterota bacterium]